MLYRHSEVFRSLLILSDLLLVAGAWLGAYAIRFSGVFPTPLGVPEFSEACRRRVQNPIATADGAGIDDRSSYHTGDRT